MPCQVFVSLYISKVCFYYCEGSDLRNKHVTQARPKRMSCGLQTVTVSDEREAY